MLLQLGSSIIGAQADMVRNAKNNITQWLITVRKGGLSLKKNSEISSSLVKVTFERESPILYAQVEGVRPH